jgi:hypothetical protein
MKHFSIAVKTVAIIATAVCPPDAKYVHTCCILLATMADLLDCWLP